MDQGGAREGRREEWINVVDLHLAGWLAGWMEWIRAPLEGKWIGGVVEGQRQMDCAQAGLEMDRRRV